MSAIRSAINLLTNEIDALIKARKGLEDHEMATAPGEGINELGNKIWGSGPKEVRAARKTKVIAVDPKAKRARKTGQPKPKGEKGPSNAAKVRAAIANVGGVADAAQIELVTNLTMAQVRSALQGLVRKGEVETGSNQDDVTVYSLKTTVDKAEKAAE